MVRMLMLGVLELHETEAAVNEEMRTTAQVPVRFAQCWSRDRYHSEAYLRESARIKRETPPRQREAFLGGAG
jgi:hypothetical protein